MKSNVTKVVIVGAGAVGSIAAFNLVAKGVAAEVVLVDVNKTKAQAEVWDLQHSLDFHSRNVRITLGEYEDCKDADIVVITASAPWTGENNRILMQDKTAAIMRSIVPSVMQSGFDGIFVVVSNPVDCISWQVMQLSGLPKNRVIGTGTILETARLKQIVGQLVGMDLHSVDAVAIGEHGDSLLIPWSHIRLGGKSIQQVLADNGKRFEDVDLNNLAQKVKYAGWHVMQAKGNTQFGIGSAVTAIVKAILQDDNKVYALSTYLDGEYGIKGIYCGVPAILGRDGIKEVAEFNLTEEEYKGLLQSADVIRSCIHRLEEYKQNA